MGNSSNKIVAAVFAMLVVGVIALAMSSGSCSGGGGGSYGQSTGTISNPASQTDAAIDYDITADDFLAMLDVDEAPLGENARDVRDSSNLLSGRDAYREFANRGFGDSDVLADFEMDGSMRDEPLVDSSFENTFPSYRLSYASAKTNVIWSVYLNDGVWMAVPLGTEAALLEREVILAETAAVVQYDSDRNDYSDFALDSLTDAVGIKVDHLDAATLDTFSMDELEKAQ